MGALLDRALAKRGKTVADLPRNTTVGKIARRRGVYDSKEFKRIRDMPRRTWQGPEDEARVKELIELITEELKTPGGTMELLPQQAVLLQEAHDFRGALGSLPVGTGKTLPSLVLATLLKAKRPVLFLPAKLIDKTDHEKRELSRHWKISPRLQILSYESLGVLSGEHLLENYLPDLIICDEAHRFKHMGAIRTQRMRDFLHAHPDVPFIPLSGTLLDSALKDLYHIQQWALPSELQILPALYKEAVDWGLCLDDRVTKRLAPGALLELCTPEEQAKGLNGVREAIGRRWMETPGVISVQGPTVKCSITVELDVCNDYSDGVDEAFELMRRFAITPDEWDIQDSIVEWSHKMQFALEFYYMWDPRPPLEWLDVRKRYMRAIREAINGNRQGWYSELQILNAVKAKKRHIPEVEEWRKMKPTYAPNPVTVWLGDKILHRVGEWMEKERGIVWVAHRDFGTKLSKLTGAPFFSSGAKDAKGRSIVHCSGGPIICSIKAINEGQNLQDRWHKNYYTYPPGTAWEWQQTIARTHRMGQKADNVSVEILIGCLEHYAAYAHAKSRAGMVEPMLRQDQKLLLADHIGPSATEVLTQKGFRWQTATKEEKKAA